jgi:hypothetical protein
MPCRFPRLTLLPFDPSVNSGQAELRVTFTASVIVSLSNHVCGASVPRWRGLGVVAAVLSFEIEMA